ncbi:MAG: methyl-accepting chemotaxis protein [Bacteroidota bacterium]
MKKSQHLVSQQLYGILLLGSFSSFTAIILATQFSLNHLFWILPFYTIILSWTHFKVKNHFVVPVTKIIDVGFSSTDQEKQGQQLTLIDVLEEMELNKKNLINMKNSIDQLINGDFSEEWHFTDQEAPLAKSLLKLKIHLQNTIKDVQNTVSIAAMDGDLSARLLSEDQHGFWFDMYEGINELLQSFSNPLNELNTIIKALANGDLTQRYQNEAKGDIAEMAKRFNAALNNIDGLLNQVSKNAGIIDETVSEMKVASVEMRTSTGEIAASIAEMSNGAQTQVSKMDESSSLIEIMLHSCNEMENLASEITSSAQKGVDSSADGKAVLEALEGGINRISTLANKTSESFTLLLQRFDAITKILGVMNDITSQTNLLALNAAIEAAQAGDAGRGFSVVAEEIRKLAEDAKRSAKEIESLIASTQKDVKDATQSMNAMGKSVQEGEKLSADMSTKFEDIFHSLEDNLDKSSTIFGSAKKQSEDISKIVGITENIVVIAEETAAGSEQIAASSSQLSSGMESYNERVESLNSIAEEFNEGVSMLKVSGNDNTVIFKMKEAYEKEKSLLDALLNNMPDFIYFKDLESKFIRVSKSMIPLFNVSSVDQIHGKSDFDFFGDHAKKAYEDEQRIIATETPLLNDVEKEDRKDGSTGYVSTNKLPLYDAANTVVGTFGISRDITTQKEAELDIQAKADKLDQCFEEKKALEEQLAGK